MIKLDSRLTEALTFFGKVNTLCDIGCDHGKLCCKAVLDGACERAIAVDISRDSLKKAQLLAAKYGISDKVDCRLGDGLSVVLENEVDRCVIAGMGGFEIINILRSSNLNIKTYTLVPHTSTTELRQFLAQNNYTVHKEKLVECKGKKYFIMQVAVGFQEMQLTEIYCGKNIEKSAAYYAYFKHYKKKLLDFRKMASGQKAERLDEEIVAVGQVLAEEILEVQNEY